MSVTTPFGETLVVSKSHQISLDSTGGLSALRDLITVVGGGTVTNTTGVHVMSISGAGDSAILETAQTGTHQGSNAYVVNIGLKIPTLPTGQQAARWGYFNNTSGYGFGVDSTGYYVFTRTGGVETKVYQTDWVSDANPAGGSMPPIFDLTHGSIFGITASWYGEIEFSAAVPNSNGDLVDVTLHRINNNFPVVDNPNCPIRVQCFNNTTSAALTINVGTRDFSTLRNEHSQSRFVSNLREAVSFDQNFSAVMSVRRKQTFPFSNTSCRLLSLDSSCTTSVLFRIVRNATLSSPVWVPPNYALQTETCCEVDVSATTVTNTDLCVHQWMASPGVETHEFPSHLQFVRNQPYTLMMKSLFGEGGCALNLRWSEEW